MSMQNVEPFDGLQTLGDIARVHARLRPDTMALKFEGRTTTCRTVRTCGVRFTI